MSTVKNVTACGFSIMEIMRHHGKMVIENGFLKTTRKELRH
jgi:hypothetical protein